MQDSDYLHTQFPTMAAESSSSKLKTEVAIQMQPLLQRQVVRVGTATAVPTAAPVPAVENVHGIDILRKYGKFFLDYKSKKTRTCYAKIIDSDSGDVIFNLNHNRNRNSIFSRASNRSRSIVVEQDRDLDLFDSIVNFMDSDGKILFRSKRKQLDSCVESGDMELGTVSGECCASGRTFVVSTSNPELGFHLDPVGLCSGCCWSCVNSCCASAYMIYNVHTDEKIGTIKCGEKIEIEIESSIHVEAKAVLLAAAVVIFELYYSPCVGNVGDMGSRTTFACTLIFMPTLVMIGIIIFKLMVEEE